MKFVPKQLKETADISRGATSWQTFLKNVLSVIVVLGVLYFLLGVAADFAATHIPDHWEARMFSAKFGESDHDLPEFRRAQALFERLVQQPGLRPLPYKFFLLHISQPNAVAIPGGAVGVSPALLKTVTSETGLAFVLGHELGHHQGRHSLKRLGRGLLLQGVVAILFGESGTSVLQASLHLAESSYSRQQEREADEFGLRLVYRAFGHTKGCLEFFEEIQKEHESGTPRWSALLASHPYTPDRIAYLRELQESLSKTLHPANSQN